MAQHTRHDVADGTAADTAEHAAEHAAEHTAPEGLLPELAVASADVVAQSQASVAALRSTSPVVWVVVALWVVGIVGDAATTLLMMGTGRFEEANGSAAALMGVFGVGGWVALSAVLCLALASLTLARPRSAYAWAAAGVAMVVCLGKVYTAGSNAVLWWTVTH